MSIKRKKYRNIKLFILLFLFSANSIITFSQTPVTVYESTLKIAGHKEETYLFGLAKGDKLVFNFEEVDGKELKEVEIIEYPSAPKFTDYKTSKIAGQIIPINKTGIYQFRLSNSSLGGRVCKIKIQRIPASPQTANFNTSVYWKMVNDTIYEGEKEAVKGKPDTSIVNITDQITKVHAAMNKTGNITSFNFILPYNTVAWSYYIGVNQEGMKVFSDAEKRVTQTAGAFVSHIPGYGPLAALALYGISYFKPLEAGENVEYWFVDEHNCMAIRKGEKKYAYYKKGNVVNDFSRMTRPLKGQYFLCLKNDNYLFGIEVTVKITAICVTPKWDTKSTPVIKIQQKRVPYLTN